ncbi:TetR/AcrR family transcriptional regulator [Pseudonocardia sp. WMMC193]|uniref:TetR/AcrR family transcriptional regulator n=1 Tax=Pseudonocardia sp. WMMC193 TaxID=2911965 RepID=UPI001F3FA449|nr:TetR/AcrR family transcriptional regulator [Pseudonocardia sp. WMMC193]MCF7547848.1 TetR/AcrR family transcriptional regulator [Pseudonocardia sp. WMMC193]
MPTPEDPRWAPAAPAGRRGLSRAAIVETAVRLADTEGLEAVSMPRLARELGAAPMSLYRHVPHKDALVDLMLDEAIGAPPDLVGASVPDGLAAWARANRAVFQAHPWTLPLVTGPRRMGPAECTWAETALALIVGSGATLPTALRILHLVNGYVRGAATPTADRAPAVADIEASGRDLPLLTRVLSRPPWDDGEDLFEFGLARVLDGVTAALRGDREGADEVRPR